MHSFIPSTAQEPGTHQVNLQGRRKHRPSPTPPSCGQGEAPLQLGACRRQVCPMQPLSLCGGIQIYLFLFF